jgi:multidrug efflux pump subunit AcrA (membrane-fusion protein)
MTTSLAGLAVNRAAVVPPARRRTALVAVALLIAATAVTVILLWDRLRPALAVPTSPVVAAAQGHAPVAGAVLARASGWVAPDPHAFSLSAEQPGTLRTVALRPGQAVVAGEVVATLDARDADLALRRAEALAASASAGRDRAQAEVDAAAARLAQVTTRHDRLRLSGDAISAGDLEQAGHEVTVRAAELAAARTTAANAAAASTVAAIERDAAALAQERCVIRAPSAGIVLRVVAAPGQRLGLDDGASALLAELYDPAHLLVRADVPLGEAGLVVPDQRAEITCDLLADRVLEGRVSGFGGTADAARNTLPVFISLVDAPPLLRPETLVRVRILGEATATPAATAGQRLLAPSAGLRRMTGDRAEAWIIAADGRLRLATVHLGGPDANGWTPVNEGLALGDPVVLGPDQGLLEGRRAISAEER